MSLPNENLWPDNSAGDIMLPTMAKKPKRQNADGSEKRKPISYLPKPDIDAALRAFRDAQPVDPGNSKVIDQALRMFLRTHGHDLPEKSGSDD